MSALDWLQQLVEREEWKEDPVLLQSIFDRFCELRPTGQTNFGTAEFWDAILNGKPSSVVFYLGLTVAFSGTENEARSTTETPQEQPNLTDTEEDPEETNFRDQPIQGEEEEAGWTEQTGGAAPEVVETGKL
jgi:hypothetical protein